ncbi:hypothetical protein N7476_010162 [Penicillium atrosanguineum]|uniref:Mannosyltransferase n=1 Tax=Penicillium atrosanguineum TaxID=1132637 RepID=A0A9W9PSS6_9EURO|nr:hypothetical protein N7476_010162 [Penicillium atrosanguineum]
MRHIFTILGLVLPALIFLHLLVAPYTKVEESFHVQATHDILVHGFPVHVLNVDRTNYDHFAFPGAVPRSAIGAAILAKLSRPIIALSNAINPPGIAGGGLYTNGTNPRAILGLYNAAALLVYAHGVRRSFGFVVATWYLAFQASQFHLIYYASRPLSNMFAFGQTTLAMRFLLPDSILPMGRPGSSRLSLILLTMAGVIFRSELAVLVATQTLFLLITRQARFFQDAVYAGIVGLFTALTATVITDSFFWDRLVWPELDAFLFNVVSGQSSEWGTDPWYSYFLNALPRLLMNPLTYLVALPVALRQPATRQPAIALLVPSLAFVALYSIIPHKEWRFIIYVVPSLTTAASLGAGYLWNHRQRSVFARIASHALVLSTLATFLLSNLVLLPASAANYPGAYALDALHRYHDQVADGNANGASVYLGNLACQTGITRFLEQPAALGWHYDKTEDEATKSLSVFWDQFDYILVEASADPDYKDSDETQLRIALPDSHWDTADTIDGFAGISIVRPGSPADGTTERKLLSVIGGQRAVNLYEQVRDALRKVVLRGWWVELKMQPKLKVLKRVQRH